MSETDRPYDGYAVAAGLAAIALSVANIDAETPSAANPREAFLYFLEIQCQGLKQSKDLGFSPEQKKDIQRMQGVLVNHLQNDAVLALGGPSGSA